MKLSLSTREIRNIFVLLGDKENDMTCGLGWVLSRSEEFLGAVLEDLTGQKHESIADAVVKLQTSRVGTGKTDIEVDVGMDVAVIFEAKRDAKLPSEEQLQRYDAVLGGSAAKQKLLVALTNATPEDAKAALSGIRITNAQLLDRSWEYLTAVAKSASANETEENERWLNDFAYYVGTCIRPAHQPKEDCVPADKITKAVLLDLAARWPAIWTYDRRQPPKLFFSCDNGINTNASARLDFNACKPFLEIGPADKSLKLDPRYKYWHILS